MNGEDISIHALREEGDMYSFRTSRSSALFLSTPSARRATDCGNALSGLFRISIHALREEGDGGGVRLKDPGGVFLSTPSARRATGATARPALALLFLSTPSARRATEERVIQGLSEWIFLSTPSARRAT